LSAAELLYHFRIVSTDPEKDLKALWGTLASEILVDHTDSVLEDFGHLRSAIDSRVIFLFLYILLEFFFLKQKK